MNKSIGVIGAGTMGAKIAQACLTGGFRVFLYDIRQEALNQAHDQTIEQLKKLEERNKITGETFAAWMDNFSTVSRLEGLADCHLVIEAVIEKLDVKQQVFADVEKVVFDQAILASNTSGISISRIAESCRKKDRVIGIHFFNPADRMPLVEIIKGEETSFSVLEQTVAIVKQMGKTPVTVKDVPGFLVNRIISPMLNEAIRAVEAGIATPEDIDQAIKMAMGHPMGPLALSDFIGLDTLLYFYEDIYSLTGADQYKPSNLLREMVGQGFTGVKSGRGFYLYQNSEGNQ